MSSAVMLPVAGLATQLQQALGPGYRVEREVGAGGMARVFLASMLDTDGALRRQVAVKVMSPAVANCCSEERFRHEMAVAAALDHPNIVPLLRECDVCTADRLPYFVMPYVSGPSLRALLARRGRLPATEVVGIVRDVASALAHAHAAGVVHRDIKPENVLMSGDRAMVTDFGIAKALDAVRAGLAPAACTTACDAVCDAAEWAQRPGGLTVAGQVLGTPGYMAPEQASGDPRADHRVDLYALGVVAFELLVGRPPFTARTPQALLAAHVLEAPPALPASLAVPPRLGTLVRRLLAKAPEERPATAAEVLRAL